jgi:hypothetical protein
MRNANLWRIFVLLLSLAALPTLSLSAQESQKALLAGTYKNEELTLTIASSADSVKGTVLFEGVTYNFTATRDGDDLKGKFGKGDDEFEFTAKLADDKLTFTTEGTTYELSRVVEKKNPLAKPGKPNPLAKPNAKDKPNPLAKARASKGVTDPTKGWKSFKHPTGLMIKYPPDWTALERDEALLLSPPDAGKNEAGATEIYLVMASPAEGVANASDERVIAYIESQLAALAPFLKRKDKPEAVPAMKTPGSLLQFEGDNPKGKAILAQVYTTIVKGYGISLVAIGEKALISKRDAFSRAMFGTVGDTEAQLDPALIGRWHYYSYKSSADGKFGTERDEHIVLAPDGAVSARQRSESSGNFSGKDSGGAETFRGGVSGGKSGGSRGRWSAGGGKIYIQWEDGSTEAYEYVVRGGRGARRVNSRPVGSSAKPQEWAEE